MPQKAEFKQWQKYHNYWELGDVKYEVGDDEPWIKLGEKESNLIRRYELVRKHH